MRKLNSKEKELIKLSGLSIWVPTVKKLFWKIYWVKEWNHWDINGDQIIIHLNGERKTSEHDQELIKEGRERSDRETRRGV